MKNLLLAFSIASIFAACNTEPKKDLEVKTDMVPINTAGYTISNASTDVGNSGQQEEYIAPVRYKSSTRTINKRNNNAISRERDNTGTVQQAPVAANTNNTATAPETKAPETVPVASTGTPSSDGKGETASAGTGNTDTEKTTKKKGWSDAAKGAVIGGAAGAIGGAIINGKNRGVGAVVGAVIGAAGGYAIGRKRDKNKQENEYSMVVN